jgi:hypothetical protein
MIIELGTMAAEARTSLYALKLDNEMFDIAERGRRSTVRRPPGGSKGSSCSPARRAGRSSP